MFGKNFELEKLKSENKKLKNNLDLKDKENKILKYNNKAKDEVIKDLDNNNYREKYNTTNSQLKGLIEINKEQTVEIEELKKKVNLLESKLAVLNVRIEKDSSNSSKPSSTNGFKKVITNRREKSNKPKGGQLGHKGTCLSEETVDTIIKSGEAEVKIIEVNKTEDNKDKEVKVRTVIDIKVIKTVTVYKYYPDCNGLYNIPTEHNSPVQYGSEIKAISTDLLIDSNNSTDAVKRFVSSISDNAINPSKGTLINWLELCRNKLEPQLVNIQEKLLESEYVNADEVTIKINGTQSYGICTSNKEYTRLWISENKSKEAINNINFMPHYKGTIVKDGTNLYDGFGKALSQCVSHVLRYIKGVYDFNSHKYAIQMSQAIQDILDEREKYLAEGKNKFTNAEYKEHIKRIKSILADWKKEWMNSNIENNPVYDDERRLLQRFEEPKEFNEIFYFMKDFKIPPTNNQAEADQRPIKIKQKIGKFRSKIRCQILY